MKNNRKKHAIIPTLGTLDWHHTPTANGKEEKASHGAPLSQVPKKSPIPKGLVKKHLLTRMKGNKKYTVRGVKLINIYFFMLVLNSGQ